MFSTWHNCPDMYATGYIRPNPRVNNLKYIIWEWNVTQCTTKFKLFTYYFSNDWEGSRKNLHENFSIILHKTTKNNLTHSANMFHNAFAIIRSRFKLIYTLSQNSFILIFKLTLFWNKETKLSGGRKNLTH